MTPLPAAERPRDLVAMQARALRQHYRHGDPEVRPARHSVGLWLPLTPLFWLLSPFALLLAPLIALAPPLQGVNPYIAVWRLGEVLTSLGGTVVHVDARDAHVRIRIL
jgi:hypothetical protein